MSRYTTRKYDNSDNIKMILNELKIPAMDNNITLERISDYVDKEIYKENMKTCAKDNCALTRSVRKLYSLVLGQCTNS